MKRYHDTEADITEAASLLKQGELIAFPTETVYGLGGDAARPEVVARIYAAKGRPPGHPLIVHLPSSAMLSDWARNIPDDAWRLAAAFWPGPLTLILHRSNKVPDAVTGGQDTVGIRVPDHPVAQALLTSFGGGLAAPSANRYGRVSPTSAGHVINEFETGVAGVIDGGACRVGLESTIIDLTGAEPVLVRSGAITPAMIEEVTGKSVRMATPGSVRAPGTHLRHYAPDTPLRLVEPGELVARLAHTNLLGKRAGVLALSAAPTATATPACLWRHMPDSADDYGHLLYATLRELDRQGADLLLAELPPDLPEWAAVRDRLFRAAHPPSRTE